MASPDDRPGLTHRTNSMVERIRTWSSTNIPRRASLLHPYPSRDVDVEAGVVNLTPAIEPRPSALSFDAPRPPGQRAPTGAQINRALNRAFSQEIIQHDDLNDLGGEQPHVEFEEDPISDDNTIVEEEGHKSRFPSKRAWKTYFTQEVAGDRYLEMQLLLMTIVTGSLDAMTFTTYNVYTTKQTGNALFLALYAFRNPSITSTEQNVGISMAVFLAGALFWGQIGRVSRQRRRIWLAISQFIQAFMILGATAVRYWTNRTNVGGGAGGVLALLAFAMSGQIATALNVNMPELNTTMITGALVALMSDKDLFALRNTKRLRRILFFASMEAGSFTGAALLNFRSPTSVLLFCACMKFGIAGTFIFNKGMVRPVRQLEDGRVEKGDGAVTPVSKILWGD